MSFCGGVIPQTMADISNVFKATIKSIKSRNKTSNKDNNKDDKNRILPTSKNRGQFETTAREVVSSISKLQEFLLNHRKNYLNAGSHLSGDTCHMTDTERDQIDFQAQNIIKKCQDSLQHVQKSGEDEKIHPQVREHRENVVSLINIYLKGVCKIYSEQKAIRVKRVVDRKRISRIEPERRSLAKRSKSEETDISGNASRHTGSTENTKSSPLRVPSHTDGHVITDSEDELSPEETQMFEEENKAMFEEMNSLSSELSKIQGKVVEIASLQEIFTDKVLQQEEDINRIADTAVSTTENIKDANEEIREAMKKNAGFRVWILFFLLVLTFSLLFLDWYSG